MVFVYRVCLLLLFVAATVTAAEIEPVLEYNLKGLEGDLRQNTLAWLGPAPERKTAVAPD